MKKFLFLFPLILVFISAKKQERFFTDEKAAIITLWKDSAIGAIYNKATQTVAYGKPNKKGIYHIFLSDTLDNNEQPLTWPG
jgi:hypothetical protein